MNATLARIPLRWSLLRALVGTALAAMMALLPTPVQGQATLLHTLPAVDQVQTGTAFGRKLASDGSRTVVGSHDDDTGATNSGVVQVFNATTGALLHVLVNPNPSVNGQFGVGVSISGTTVVVGASGDDTGATDAGRVYVYDLSSGTPTVPVFTLENPSPNTGDAFGGSVAVAGTRVAVGVTRDDTGAMDAGIAYVYDLSGGTPTTPAFTLNNPSPTSGDLFGNAVGISGTRVVVAAVFDDTGATDAGSVYVFDVSGGTTPIFTLNNPSPSANDNFGSGLGIFASRVVVGAPFDDTGASNAGVAYVFDLSGGTPTVPAFTLTNPSGQALDSFMGLGVAISGTNVVVGAYLDDTGANGAGIVYVFDLTSGTPTTAAFTLPNPDPDGDDRFGLSVAISGTFVAATALNDDGGRGSVFLFNVAGGTPTVPLAKLPSRKDEFGTAVAVDGNLMVVGAPRTTSKTNSAATVSGAVYIYDLSSGTPTVPIHTLTRPNPLGGEVFGSAVAISGNRVVVGAVGEDAGAEGAGGVYIYDLGSGTPTVPLWVLDNPAPEFLEAYGNAVAISGPLMVVGVYQDNPSGTFGGSAYVYDLSTGTPAIPIAFLTNPTPEAQDYFGITVAVSGTRVVIGASNDSTGAANAGSAYVYDMSSGTPTVPVRTLNNPSPSASANFGNSVAIEGNRVAVGAPNEDTGASNAGSVYIYDLAGASPTVPVTTVNNPAPAAVDQFGTFLALSGGRIVVGTPRDDAGASNAGSAYVYDLNSAAPTVPVATLANPAPAANDEFARAVAISGQTVLIGAYHDDTTALDQGTAYVFTVPGGGSPTGVIIAVGSDATGAGLPPNTTFTSFTAPDVGVFGGRVLTPDGKKLDAVFDETGTVLLRGEQMVVVEPGGGGEMGMIAKLAPPTGDAVLATLNRRSGATAANDQVLFLGLQSGDPEAMVRKGQEVPGLPGVTLKSFLTLDGNGDTTFFSGKLAGTGVNGGNNTAIFAASPTAGFKMMVRKGQTVDGKVVKIIATLVGTAGTLAEGRWRGGPDDLGVRLTFADKTQALYLVPVTATGPGDWLRIAQGGDPAGADVPGGLLKSFMLPAHAPDAVVFDSLLQIGPGSITRKNNRAVFDALGVDTRGPIALRLLAQVAGPAPALTNVQRFLNMLAGQGRAATMIANASLQGQRTSRATIFDAGQDGVLVPIARSGDDAPGGGRWDRFVSVAKPDGPQGYGALISALLKVDGRAGVTAKNRAALFARDSTGMVQRILRAGDMIESAGPGSPLKSVKSFVALTAAPGSIGAARGYDATGKVNVLVTFPDRTQAVVSLQVP